MEQLLHYRTSGRPDSPALLLIHPLGSDLRFWDECVALWDERYYCIACDLQSAGLSPRPDVPAGLGEHVADLERLRAGLGVPSVVPIGCAIGGMVAASYAARHPEQTRALIVTNPGLRNSEAARTMLRERVGIVRKSGMAVLLPGAADRAFHQLPHDLRYEHYVERYGVQDPERYALSVLGFLDADVRNIVPRVRCRTLIVAGEHDILMPAGDGPAMKDLMPRAEFTLMQGVAHFLLYQAPDRFAAMAARFLDGVSLSGASDGT